MSPKGSTILVTGGCGYVGSHTVLSLLESGYKVVVLDNLSNTSNGGTDAAATNTPEALKRIQEILSIDEPIPFYPVDIVDKPSLIKVFEAHPDISAVIHCAGLKSVGESGRRPLDYYNVNIAGTVYLLQVMEDFNVRRIVFSSSATVYGDPPVIPIPETSPIVASMSPYGRTKVFLEHIIRDLCVASSVKQKEYEKEQADKGAKVEIDYRWSAMLLRYFNPAGAHPSGIMGEDPQGIPNNLMPYLAQVAVGNLEKLTVFGNDYPTKDGTCIRDYLHVVDCADGHVAALEKIERDESEGKFECKAYNLGVGTGCSVLDMVRAFSKAVGRDLPYEISGRRAGDVPNLTADPSLANKELNWKAVKTLDQMCEDLWRWQRNNPNGFRTQK
ncbi:UDP-glucose-4-epimerase [Lobosporangium transversale]|uniref:UDP-glucose 4-epimerase n=1 Tax=Lobosporangium transversale TaxID=64571 RepID=A0A1Y2GF43_9FUNG|nr:galactose-4-epimerase, UDP [Lobosporangium transversale]KAF9903411.1 UDP-glucose-4-epimerase [Lobosporangium transversale]ORZ07248.1 galactose-4-epimerase, UDP [Lobosporangium transversale]|eukprot:XP_021877911.1 galactose-4-epimerase, UDP [Lobosporangium transversale]